MAGFPELKVLSENSLISICLPFPSLLPASSLTLDGDLPEVGWESLKLHLRLLDQNKGHTNFRMKSYTIWVRLVLFA